MVFQGFPTQAEALSEVCTHPFGLIRQSQAGRTWAFSVAQCLGVVAGVMMGNK